MISDIAEIYYAVLRDNKRFNPPVYINDPTKLRNVADECNFYSILQGLRRKGINLKS